MRFSDGFLDEIRNKLPITQIVGEHVVWDKRKSQPQKGDMWACCPFHSEKTPSFHADDRRGRYYCFSCQASGDHFRFLTQKTGISFPEAVEKLANLAGIPMPKRDEQSEKRQNQQNLLFNVMELATKYFEMSLSENIGAQARGYLLSRNITPKLQNQFRIGFAPNLRNGLKEYLAQKNVTLEQMIAAGLVVSGEDIAIPYDRFRNRVIFPIMDYRGRVIAFGGRALSPDIAAKYLNSPETALFQKRKTLYNIQMARQAAYNGQKLIVVEGYTDVIALVSAGFEASVAPLGTALTEEHLAILWRLSDVPILCFDGDEAGKKAIKRVIDIALTRLEPGRSLNIITLPQGHDPDNIIANEGRDYFAKMIENAAPLSDTIFELEMSGAPPSTPEARAAFEARLKQQADMIKNNMVRRHYLAVFDEKLRQLFAPTYFKNKKSNKFEKQQISFSQGLKNSKIFKGKSAQEISAREAAILLCLINHPNLIEERLENLAQIEFESKIAQKLLSNLIDIVAISPGVENEEIIKQLEKKNYGQLLKSMQKLLNRQGIWQIDAKIAKIDAEIGLNHALALHYKSVQLNKELRAAEIALGNELSEENLEKLRNIQNQIATIDGREALIEGFGSLSGRAVREF